MTRCCGHEGENAPAIWIGNESRHCLAEVKVQLMERELTLFVYRRPVPRSQRTHLRQYGVELR